MNRQIVKVQSLTWQESEEVPLDRRTIRGVTSLEHLTYDSNDWLFGNPRYPSFALQNTVCRLPRHQIVCHTHLRVFGFF